MHQLMRQQQEQQLQHRHALSASSRAGVPGRRAGAAAQAGAPWCGCWERSC